MLGRRTYQNNFSSNSVIKVVVESTQVVSNAETAETVLDMTIAEGHTTTIDIGSSLENHHTFFKIYFAGNTILGRNSGSYLTILSKHLPTTDIGTISVNGKFVIVNSKVGVNHLIVRALKL
jgi:hypothetical protein